MWPTAEHGSNPELVHKVCRNSRVRYNPYVYTVDGQSIDEILAREGLAEAWTRDGQHRDVLVATEKGAKKDGRGCLINWSG